MTVEERRREVDLGLAVVRVVRDQAGIRRPMSYREIAECVGCSKTLIQQIEQKALKRLRHPSRVSVLEGGMSV